jgi:hypothetical protein
VTGFRQLRDLLEACSKQVGVHQYSFWKGASIEKAVHPIDVCPLAFICVTCLTFCQV